MDSDGGVIITGASQGIDTGFDYATIKYSSTGVPLWTNRYDALTNSTDDATALAVDTNGNVFVTGVSRGSSGPPVDEDFVTIAYSNAGVPLWTNRYDGPAKNSDGAVALAVDTNGNVFVTGYSYDISGGKPDYATIKYSNVGVSLWTNYYNGPDNGDDFPAAIAVDGRGNVVVTGGSFGSGSDHDYATVMYSNAGMPLWTNRYNGPGNSYDSAGAIAVDGHGSLFVTGTSWNGNSDDFLAVGYSNTGALLWINRYDGPGSGDDSAIAIAVDGHGNLFVTGYSDGIGNGLLGNDYTTIKYSSSVQPVVRLDFRRLSNQLVLSWTNAGFNLQSAPTLTGTFTDIPAATSPYTNSLASPQQFFRLQGN